MQKFKVTLWRSNPQLKNGGYEMVKIVKAKTADNARRNLNKRYEKLVYGGCYVTKVEVAPDEAEISQYL